AAGGAIVSPEAEVFTLTPICPHTLSNRSVIVSLGSEVRVTLHSRQPDSIFAADGQVLAALHPGEGVTIRRSPRSVRLLRLAGGSFFQTLRQKLNWSGSNV
ncbi:MAG: NAD(+)/NADH kinase, partial [Verrucomicrobia bacterium]|nr:NAD(+)/NADH kinase [Verrucomicrobiota bacterium]